MGITFKLKGLQKSQTTPWKAQVKLIIAIVNELLLGEPRAFRDRSIQTFGPGYTDCHKQPVRITRSVRKKSVRIMSQTFGGLVIRTVRIMIPQCILF